MKNENAEQIKLTLYECDTINGILARLDYFKNFYTHLTYWNKKTYLYEYLTLIVDYEFMISSINMNGTRVTEAEIKSMIRSFRTLQEHYKEMWQNKDNLYTDFLTDSINKLALILCDFDMDCRSLITRS